VDAELIDLLRDDLIAADYRVPAVRALLGADADAARLRGVFAPARRALVAQGEGALATLIRLFLLGEEIGEEELTGALPLLGARGVSQLGLIQTQAGRARAMLALNPVEIADARLDTAAHWWIISDLDDALRGGPAPADHVMGVGGATRTLIAQAPVHEVERALEIGTGCGAVALHLALRGPVVATDISERALRFARANARLNAVRGIEFRQGDLFAPVTGESFDLILSNPPFVVTPRDAALPRYEYRDAGLVGDTLAARVIELAPGHLRPGGTLLCLANWECPWGADGLARVAGWIAEADRALGAQADLAAWIIERDRISPVQYAETWARDGGARPGEGEYERLIEAWLADFAERRVVALGLGSIRVRRLPAAQTHAPLVHAERAAGAFSADAGARLAATFDAALRVARLDDAAMLAARWVRSDDVIEHREHLPGQEAPFAIALTAEAGIARRVTADPLLAAAVGACDGELTLAQIVDALAMLLEVDAGAAAEALIAGVRELVWLGMLDLAAEPSAVD
jgi:SAM-dependent methyltransferase